METTASTVKLGGFVCYVCGKRGNGLRQRQRWGTGSRLYTEKMKRCSHLMLKDCPADTNTMELLYSGSASCQTQDRAAAASPPRAATYTRRVEPPPPTLLTPHRRGSLTGPHTSNRAIKYCSKMLIICYMYYYTAKNAHRQVSADVATDSLHEVSSITYRLSSDVT